MHQEYKNTIGLLKINRNNKPWFDRLLRPPAWKRSGPILKEKGK